MQDPSRRGYRDILDKSEDVAEGGHILDARNRRSIVGFENLTELEMRDAEEEARMVAEAIGYKPRQTSGGAEGAALSRAISVRSDVSTRSGRSGSFGSLASADGADDFRASNRQLLKSPELRGLDSPLGSDEEDSDEEQEAENVPPYILAQEEALMKARERAIKTEEEEREREMERLQKENQKPTKRGRKGNGDADYQGAAGALAALDLLGGEKGKK